MKINSVLGPVESSELGVTLMHEHVSYINRNMANAIPGWHDEEKVIQSFTEEMERLKKYGVKTFVDATLADMGRDIPLLQECARRAGVNILCGTGIYWPETPWILDGVDEEYLADLIRKELEDGIQGTDVKPAFLKAATGVHGKSEHNKSMLRAVAKVAAETDLPIYLHSVQGGTDFYGDYQREFFLEAGVDPSRIAFGHICMLPSEDAITQIMEGGSYISYDQIAYYPDEMKVMVAQALAQFKGTDVWNHMFFSCDALNETDLSRMLQRDHRDESTSHYPTVSILKNVREQAIFEKFIPAMKEAGVTEEDIKTVMIENPRKFFEAGRA